jgi:hypothetical protein
MYHVYIGTYQPFEPKSSCIRHISGIIILFKNNDLTILFRYAYRDVSEAYRYRLRVGHDSSPFLSIGASQYRML